MKNTSVKFIFITGGVVSSLGKGLASASLGALLQARGYNVKLIVQEQGCPSYNESVRIRVGTEPTINLYANPSIVCPGIVSTIGSDVTSDLNFTASIEDEGDQGFVIVDTKANEFYNFLIDNNVKYDLDKFDFDEVVDSYRSNLNILKDYWLKRLIPICNRICGSNKKNKVKVYNEIQNSTR